jgi:hypothetical protein
MSEGRGEVPAKGTMESFSMPSILVPKIRLFTKERMRVKSARECTLNSGAIWQIVS